ncbi:MAG TPA: thioredoxin domain-containing protein [Allosphingosinicella sp.]|nr:thioredoxin domain-containing protein [Allosphingosinicella sp.]
MKRYLTAGAAAFVLTLTACGGGSGGGNNTAGVTPPSAPVENVAAPNNGDWTQVINETERGYRMGNPDAPVKLVEYASITCPHCGQFATEGGSEGIREFVRSGRVSWEYRPYMIFPTDPGLFALMRCQGPASYFQLLDQVYANQQDWATRGQTYLQANQAAFERMDVQARAAALVRETGLDAFFRQRGMPQSRIDQCLADPRNLQRVADDTQHAIQTDNPPGTPSFYINGQLQSGVGLWPQLEPALRTAVGG